MWWRMGGDVVLLRAMTRVLYEFLCTIPVTVIAKTTHHISPYIEHGQTLLVVTPLHRQPSLVIGVARNLGS